MITPVTLTDLPGGKISMPRRGASKFVPALSPTPETVMPSISFGLGKPKPTSQESLIRDMTGSMIAGCYLCIGIFVAFSTLLGDLFLQQTLIVLTPVWTLTVAQHAICRPWSELVTGFVLIVCFPFAVILHDYILWVVYFILYSMFVSSGFWREQRGVLLILSVVAWLGVLSSAGVTLLFHGNNVSETSMHFTGVFALLLGITCAQELGKYQFRVYLMG